MANAFLESIFRLTAVLQSAFALRLYSRLREINIDVVIFSEASLKFLHKLQKRPYYCRMDKYFVDILKSLADYNWLSPLLISVGFRVPDRALG
jgi:hypothetical protein